MLTATPVPDIEPLIPVLITAAEGMVTIGKDLQTAINRIPEIARRASEEAGYSFGRGAARGFGWNVLLPLGVGTAVVLGGFLIYTAIQPRLTPAYAR